MISIDRATRIIQCYGGNPLLWPKHEQRAMRHLLHDSKSLTDVQKEACALDQFMGFSEPFEQDVNWAEDQQCVSKIMAQLPQLPSQEKDSTITSNRFRQNLATAKPILLAASLVLAVIISVNKLPIAYNNKVIEPFSLAESLALYIEEEIILEQNHDEELEVLAFLEPQILDDYE